MAAKNIHDYLFVRTLRPPSKIDCLGKNIKSQFLLSKDAEKFILSQYRRSF